MKNIKLLNKQLEKQGATWRAAESRISKLTAKQFKGLLGWKKDPKLSKGPVQVLKISPKWSPGDPFDAVVDWRNRNGKNYVTPVQDQGQCGSCVAFAVAGLVESMALIEKGVLLNLSESDLAFCGSHASNCDSWGEGGALNDVKTRGVVTANKFPYASAFPGDDINHPGAGPSCRVTPNHDNYSVKISGFENIYDVSARKSYISNVGPLAAGISVYNDFYPAPGTIYHRSETAAKTGGHYILVIGYSDVEQYWLIKNSWGTSWGDGGFCKLAYGNCDIDIETATEKTYFTSCDDVIIPESVLDELVLDKGLSTLSNIPAPLCCDGFFSDDDKMRHAIVGTINGEIFEIFFNPQTGKGQSLLTNLNGLIDLGAFYTDDDKFRHVITAQADGAISEVFYSPQAGLGIAHLSNIPNAIKVCGFFSPDDQMRHAIVATSDGAVFEIFYGQRGQGQSQIGTFNNIVDIGCFYSPDDNYRHVIVGTADGNITEIFFNPQTGIFNAVLTNMPGLSKITAFYAPDNSFYNRKVQVLTNDGNIHEIRYSSANGMITNSLNNIAGIVDMGGFFSSDDNMDHCILTVNSGDILELFYHQ